MKSKAEWIECIVEEAVETMVDDCHSPSRYDGDVDKIHATLRLYVFGDYEGGSPVEESGIDPEDMDLDRAIRTAAKEMHDNLRENSR